MNTKPKHPGGRPPKDPSQKVIKCHVSLTGAHHAATKGDRAGTIRRALELAPPKEFDYCIVGKVEYAEVQVNSPLDTFMHNASTSIEIHFEGGANCILKGDKMPIRFSPGDYIKVVSFRGKYEVTNLSNPPSGDNQSKK